jgi:hypothetical protein
MGVDQGRSRILLLEGKVEAWDLHRRKVLAVLSLLGHDVIGKEVPEVQADLEELLVLDAAHLRQVGQTLESLVAQHLHLMVGLDRVGQTFDKI